MPAATTLSAIFQFETIIRKSISRLIKNRKSTAPTLAARESIDIKSLGEIALVKPGTRPNTEGRGVVIVMLEDSQYSQVYVNNAF